MKNEGGSCTNEIFVVPLQAFWREVDIYGYEH